MIHLKNSSFHPVDAHTLLAKADKLTSEMNVIVRDMRVSSRYLEFDVSVNKEELGTVIEKLSIIGSLEDAKQVVEVNFQKENAIEKAIEFFNFERYWECHEVLESVWKNTFELEKDLVQGIILVAAALVHYQKNENNICISIMNRAMEKLSFSAGKYNGIDIDQFKNTVSKIILSKEILPFKI